MPRRACEASQAVPLPQQSKRGLPSNLCWHSRNKQLSLSSSSYGGWGKAHVPREPKLNPRAQSIRVLSGVLRSLLKARHTDPSALCRQYKRGFRAHSGGVRSCFSPQSHYHKTSPPPVEHLSCLELVVRYKTSTKLSAVKRAVPPRVQEIPM